MQDGEKKRVHLDYQTKANIVRILGFVILSFCYLIFFFNTKGHLILKADVDGEFHFSRIMSLSNIWHSPVNFHYYNWIFNISNARSFNKMATDLDITKFLILNIL